MRGLALPADASRRGVHPGRVSDLIIKYVILKYRPNQKGFPLLHLQLLL